MKAPATTIFKFDQFTLDVGKRLLINGEGRSVELTSKVFDLLLCLVRRAGETVEKDELMAEIWPDTVVEENNLSQNISILRKVLGEKRTEHRFIATVPGRGYKFVADVQREEIGNAAIVAAASQTSAAAEVPQKRFSRSMVAGLVLTAAFIVGGAALYMFLRGEASARPRVKTMAVLPFRPIVAENRDESLELGIADTLISRLGESREILVRPLSSVRKFGDVEQDPQAAGKMLAVDAVLDGNIQRSGDMIRVTVRLIDVSGGASLWSGSYDEKFTDIFTVQDRIAGKVAEALRIDLANGRQTNDPEAYRLYLQGRYFSQKITAAEVRRGIEFFRRAIDLDPTYAQAYAGMADAYRSLPINGDVPSDDVMPKARAAAENALRIDTANADAHTALGWIYFWYEHDWKRAEDEFKNALRSGPSNADAHRGYSVLLTCLGRHDEAISQMALAREIDPLSIVTAALEGQTFLYAGKYDAAIEKLNRSLELDANFWVTHIQLSRIYIQQENWDGAILEAEKAERFSNGNSEAISLRAFAQARSGNQKKAEEAIDALRNIRSTGKITDYNTAMVYVGLGRNEEAIRSLQDALAVNDVRLILLKVDRRWDVLRADPRFIELMNRMNFE